MTKRSKLIIGLVALLIGVGIGVYFFSTPDLSQKASDFAGAPGNLLAEDYDPYIQYNGGFNTAKGITNSGSFTQSGATSLTSTVTVGSGGTAFSKLLYGNCALLGMNTTHTASSTKPYDCAVTGVTSSSVVFGNISTSSAPIGQDRFQVVSVKASTTAGFITFMIYNNGASIAPSVNAVGSTTPYLVINP